MEDADGIAQWNASGSRKKIIVAAGLRAEQLKAGARGGSDESKVRTRKHAYPETGYGDCAKA
jgi:hypothetical protein